MARSWQFNAPKSLNTKAIRQTVMEFMREAAKDMKADFEKTQGTWNHTVDFNSDIDGPNDLNGIFSVHVYTDDNQYRLVNKGAPPHVIFPVNGKFLRFPGTFSPKTVPGVLKANSGFSGPPMETREWVSHPGFEARKFDRTVALEFEPKFKENGETLMEAIASASGNAL